MKAYDATMATGPLPRSTRQVGPAHQRPVLRRLVDIIGATLFGVMAIPLIIGGAAISFFVYRAWPFFTHERVGIGGKDFRVRKLRTLPPSTSRYAGKYDLSAIDLPRSMRLVRTFHLDELPQLWNVIRGDMTFIGPRPEMRFLHDRLPPSFAHERVAVTPGLTGLWQISDASSGLIEEHPEYDRFYLRNRCLRLDLWIVCRTVTKIVFGHTIDITHVAGRTPVAPTAEESSAVA